MKKTTLLTFVLINLLFSLNAFSKDIHNWTLETQSGEEISLDLYKDKPIILHFWATWCPYCKKIQPKLVELQQKYKSSGVEIIAISFNEDKGALPQDNISNRGYSFLTAVNGDKVAQMYGVKGTPTTFFLNKNHDVIFKSTSSNVKDIRLELALKEMAK